MAVPYRIETQMEIPPEVHAMRDWGVAQGEKRMLRDSTHVALRAGAIEYLKKFGGFVETDWSATAIHEEYDADTGVTMVSVSLVNGKGNRLWVDCGVIEYEDTRALPSFAYMNIIGGEILNYL